MEDIIKQIKIIEDAAAKSFCLPAAEKRRLEELKQRLKKAKPN